MKAKKYLMAFVAIATLSSCSQQEEFFSGGTQSPLDENVVTFGTYLGQALQTRATSIGTEELKAGPGFGVFAYYTEEADFAENTFIPDFMRNQKVAWNGSEWFYTPLKYWPSNDDHKISFFAYAPYVAEADAVNNSITSLPEMGTKLEDGTVTKPSDPVIGFTLNPDYKKQTDLLYNDAEFTTDVVKPTIDQKVQFKFKHALSRVGFKAMVIIDEVADKEDGSVSGDGSNHKDISLGAGSTVTINSIAFKAKNVSKSGSLHLNTGKWDNLNPGELSYDFGEDDFIKGSNIFSGSASESTAADDGASDEGTGGKKSPAVKLLDEYLMLIPNKVNNRGIAEKANLEMAINYTIATDDENIAGGKIEFKQDMNVPFDFEFKQGEAYDFVIHIGLTSAKMDASVNDWGNTDTEISANRTVYESNNYLGSFEMYPYNEQLELEVTLNGKPAEIYKAKVIYQDKNGKLKYTIPVFEEMTAKFDGSSCSFLGWSTVQYDVIIDSDSAPGGLYQPGDAVEIPSVEKLDNFKLYAVWEAKGTN